MYSSCLVFLDAFLSVYYTKQEFSNALLAPSDYMVLHEFSFFYSVEDRPVLRLSAAERELVDSLILPIAGEYQASKFRSGSVLRAYLHILLVEMERISATHQEDAQDAIATQDATPNLVRHFKQLVAQPVRNRTICASLCRPT